MFQLIIYILEAVLLFLVTFLVFLVIDFNKISHIYVSVLPERGHYKTPTAKPN